MPDPTLHTAPRARTHARTTRNETISRLDSPPQPPIYIYIYILYIHILEVGGVSPTGKSISVSCFVYVIVSCDAKLCAMISGMLGVPNFFSSPAPLLLWPARVVRRSRGQLQVENNNKHMFVLRFRRTTYRSRSNVLAKIKIFTFRIRF